MGLFLLLLLPHACDWVKVVLEKRPLNGCSSSSSSSVYMYLSIILIWSSILANKLQKCRFPAPYHDLRGHNLKVKVQRSWLQLRQGFFSQRVVYVWNSLLASVVEASSVNMFKKRLGNRSQDVDF